MSKIIFIQSAIILMLISLPFARDGVSAAVAAIRADLAHFYLDTHLPRTGALFGLAALSANTNLDDRMQHWYQSNIRSARTDEAAVTAKLFGEGKIMVPVSFAAAGMLFLNKESKTGHWGMYTARAYLAGAPAVLGFQLILGGSRPPERDNPSRWRPFQDNNGVSGHAFMGAVPFLVFSRMCGNRNPLKYVSIALSFATAWSRINDDAHSFSQICLGWYMAWKAVRAVFKTENRNNGLFTFAPIIDARGAGFTVTAAW